METGEYVDLRDDRTMKQRTAKKKKRREIKLKERCNECYNDNEDSDSLHLIFALRKPFTRLT